MKIIEKIVVQNPLGLSMRDAAEIVKISSLYGCQIKIRNKSGPVDSKSILGLLALGATHGSELEFTFDGTDAGKARETFKEFFTRGFTKPELTITRTGS